MAPISKKVKSAATRELEDFKELVCVGLLILIGWLWLDGRYDTTGHPAEFVPVPRQELPQAPHRDPVPVPAPEALPPDQWDR